MSKYIDAEKITPIMAEYVADVFSRKEHLDNISYGYCMEIADVFRRYAERAKQEQPEDLASLINEARNVAKRIVDEDSFYNSLPQNLQQKYTFKAWCEILEALSTMKAQEQPEVDLEKEVEKCLKQYNMLAVGKKDFTDIARHFAEWGAIHLNARKEE